MMTEKVAENSLVPGDHGTTYGGNPFATRAISTVLDIFEEDKILDNVNTIAPYLEEKLDELVAKYDFLTGRRGKGLMRTKWPWPNTLPRAVCATSIRTSAG